MIFSEATQLNEAGEPEDWNFRVMIPTMMKVIQNQNERINTLERYSEHIERKTEQIRGNVERGG